MTNIQKNLKWYLFGFLCIGVLFITFVAIADTGNKRLTVAFLDVGQGDSIYIEAPNGKQILIDGGANKKVLSELGDVMPFYDRSIDVVIATHPDKDHIGGLIPVLDNFSVGSFIDPGVAVDTNVYDELQDLIEEKNIKHLTARRGMIIVLDKERHIFMQILFPDKDVSSWNPNDASIITKLIYGENEFLMTGDAPGNMERYITYLDGENLESDVLKLGHHGSKTSSAESFLKIVNPELAVISAGRDNRYGHPDREVLDRLEDLGIPYIGTYEKGTIILVSDGKKITIY